MQVRESIRVVGWSRSQDWGPTPRCPSWRNSGIRNKIEGELVRSGSLASSVCVPILFQCEADVQTEGTGAKSYERKRPIFWYPSAVVRVDGSSVFTIPSIDVP